MSHTVQKVASSLSTAGNTDSLIAFATIGGAGSCDFSMFSNSTQATMTVHVQSRLEGEPHWVDVKTFDITTASKSLRQTLEFGSSQRFRGIIKSGNHTSGTIRLVLTQGGYTR